MAEYIEFGDVELVHQTNKAALLRFDDGEFWVPWSQIEENGEDFKTGYVGTVFISEWFCEKEGL